MTKAAETNGRVKQVCPLLIFIQTILFERMEENNVPKSVM